ncbi:MAG TPA: hypothetical protein VJS47_03380 [Rhizomicrobium sp.]|nr:hypothetical protein [Rhizomicrobium sp.]
MSFLLPDQKIVCAKYGAQCEPCDQNFKIGISKNFDRGNFPINGLRHPIVADTSGWYIWSGEQFSTDQGFFVPLHAFHLNDLYPEIVKYLGLAPGWRFLFSPEQEDVWFDEKLLLIEQT